MTQAPARRGWNEQTRLFARMSAFGLIVGGLYWFLTYEVTGTVLLLAFGAAAGIAALAIFVGGWAAGRRARFAGGLETAAPERDPVPRPGWAPLGIAIGLGGVALGAAFGPWLAIAGALFAIRSMKAWLDAAVEETDEARGMPRSDVDE